MPFLQILFIALTSGLVSWRLHAYVLEAEIGLFNSIASCLETAIDVSIGSLLPPFSMDTIDDSE